MLIGHPINAAAACREGAASVRSGPELPDAYAEELEAIAARLDAIRDRMAADLNALPRRQLPELEVEEDWGDPDYVRRPMVARGAVLTTTT